MFLAQAIFAQTTITIQAENAAEEFAKLSVGEYNIVVKGDLKWKNEWHTLAGYIEESFGLWKTDVTINVLDLSGVIGLDSIKGYIVYDYIAIEGGVYPRVVSKLILPDNVVYLNARAFDKVDEVIVSHNNKTFKMQDKFLLSKDGKELYYYNLTSGTSLQIPDGVEIIKSKSIRGLYKDTIKVNLSKSVKELESNCFEHNLFLVEIPKYIKNISSDNYHNISGISKGNKYYTMENGVIYNKDKTTLLYAGKVKGCFVIPSGVKKIGQFAFYKYYNEDLESIVLPETLEVIDSHAFSFNDESWTGVNIPKSVKWIGRYNFSGLGIKEIGDTNNWYFTTNEADWLKRQNGMPVSVILSENGDNLRQILKRGIWYKRALDGQEDKMEYASWYDPKKFDIKETYIYSQSFTYEDFDGSEVEEKIFFIRPFFYKLD